MYKRTQLYFPEDLFEEIKAEAKKQKTSIADIVRVAMRDFINRRKITDWDKDPVWGLIGKGKSKEGNLSVKHDYYLYRGK
jgi:hypothetical protein